MRYTMYDISLLFHEGKMAEKAVFTNNFDPNPNYRTIFCFKNYIVVVKRCGNSMNASNFSIKLSRDPQHLFETFARWNTNIRLTSGNDIHREIEFALEQFNSFLADVGCDPIE